jgi:hypothetical protein
MTISEVEFSLNTAVMGFMRDVADAQRSGSQELEAHPEVVKHFQPDGVGDAGYFWYQGIRVYEQGKLTEEGKALEHKEASDLAFMKGGQGSGAV